MTEYNVTFTDYDVVFCDSIEALEAARRAGLPATARILSSSPALLKAEPAAENVDARPGRDKGERFIRSIGAFTEDLYGFLQSDPAFANAAIAGAYGGFIYHMVLHKALVVRSEDLCEPRLVLQPATGDERIDRVVRSLWPELLSLNPSLKVVEIPVSMPGHGTSMGGVPPTLPWRLRNLRLERLIYQVLIALDRHLPARWRIKPDILVLRDSNELVKDTAVALAGRGYRLRRLKLPAAPPSAMATEQSGRLRTLVSAAFDRHYAALFTPQLRELLISGLSASAQHHIESSWGVQKLAANRLASYRADRNGTKAIILHGAPMRAGGAGLHAAARQLGIPMLGFQHGVRREIADWPLDANVINENNYCDAMLTFNKVAARVSVEGNVFAAGPATVIGMPSDYWRLSRQPAKAAKQPVLFASTLLYRGIRQLSVTLMTDLERGEREVGVIDNVLARIPHRVLYKPYPSFRYVDQDPALTAALHAQNVDVFLQERDLRFMLREHRVVVTGGATSTIGWCVLSGLPLVFIDHPLEQPLKPDARRKFENAFFLFDAAAPDFHERLRDFLSQPIEVIEAAARPKAAARQAVIEEFFGAVPQPGRAGRDAVLHHVRQAV